MQISDQPKKITIEWARDAGSGFVRDIPLAPSGTAGAASWPLGFPPPNFTDPAAGGIPPFGQDMNGVLQIMSAWVRWQQGGGWTGYDAAYSAAVGGYFNGAVLLNAAGTGFWKSTVDNNTSDPDTGGSGWAVVKTGTYAFSDITGVPAFVLASAFNGSLGPNGYQPIPGGLILQWGRFTAPGGGGFQTVALPTSFLSAAFVALAVSANATTILGTTSVSLSSIVVQNGGGAGNFFAIGR